MRSTAGERQTVSVDTSTLLRVYLDPEEIDEATGYPWQWEGSRPQVEQGQLDFVHLRPRIPDYVRELTGHRCIRCGHPFYVGKTPGEWSRCDEKCTHGGPTREGAYGPEAQWRVLTVHHLNGVKHDCRWHNLVALCQRCHLTIQGKVYMERPYPRQHSEWFKPYVAGFYASKYLGIEVSREEAMERLDELLLLERTWETLW